MPDLTFNTVAGQTIAREMLIVYLNTATQANPVWNAIGKRVEDSSIEFDWGKETKQDILGNSWTTLKKPTMTESFEPCELDSDDAAQVMLWNKAIKDKDAQALANMDCLLVHFYAGDVATPFAERYESCAITPTGLGGEGGGNVGMPIEVDFGGKRTVGTASVSGGVVTFTPEEEQAGE